MRAFVLLPSFRSGSLGFSKTDRQTEQTNYSYSREEVGTKPNIPQPTSCETSIKTTYVPFVGPDGVDQLERRRGFAERGLLADFEEFDGSVDEAERRGRGRRRERDDD